MSTLELMVVAALILMTATLATQPLLEALATVRLRSYAQTFLSHLLLIRSEAIKRRVRVVLCPSEDGVACAATGLWSRGWMGFVDGNNSGQREPEESVLLRHESMGEDFRLVGNQSVARYLSYDAHGQARMTTGAFQAGTYTLCRKGKGPRVAHLLVLSSMGRPRMAQAQVPDCT